MDLKGISWVGNMYQKFEAMCVEVEETLYEDTVQYVENQAKTVGTCLKKFYADVMQDLLLESCVDPTKADNPGQGFMHHADIEYYGGPKASVKKEPINVKRAVRKNSRTSHAGKQMDERFFAEQSPAVNISKPLPQDEAEDKWADWNWEQNESDPGFRIRSNRRIPSPEISRQTPAVTKQIGIASSDAEIHCVEEATESKAQGPDSASLCVGKGASHQENAKTNESVASMAHDSPSLDTILNENGSEGTELIDLRDIHMPSDSDVLKSPDAEMSSDENMRNVEESCLPNTGSSNHSNETLKDDHGDVGIEVARMLDSINLEDSCVLVDKCESSISNTPGKRRSYKKKIRDVLSPRKWSKTREREQLYEDRTKSSLATCTTNPGERSWEAPDSCESEWELL